MGIRYQVPGWPSRVLGHSAVVPHFTRPAGSGAMEYKDGLTGQPGTAAVAAPPAPVPAGPVAQAMSGFSRSADAPNMIYPNQYWARPERQFWPGAGMPVSVQSDNLMPIPATDPRGVGAVLAEALALAARSRGGAQIQSYPTLAMWPDVNS